MQILGLVVQISALVAKNTVYLIYYSNYDEYAPFRDSMIIETVCFIADLFNYMIIASVIYKSSKVVGLKHDPILKKDVSLLAYMRS